MPLPLDLDALCQAAGFSTRTRTTYAMLAGKFDAFLARHRIPWVAVTPTLIDRFFADHGHAQATRTSYLAALNLIFDAMIEQGTIIDQPARAVQARRAARRGRTPKRLPAVLSDAEVQQLLEVLPNGDTLTARRTRMIVQLLLETGMRREECANLPVSAFDLGRNPVIRVIGKGNKEREIPLTPDYAARMQDWLDERERFGIPGRFCFAHQTGTPLTPNGIYQMLRRLLVQAGIAKTKMGPHVLRHTFATRQLRAGIAPAVVKLWLGHASLATTLKVYEHVADSGDARPVAAA